VGMMFAKTDKPKMARVLNRVRAIFPSNSRARFGRYVKQSRPDVVLCTHYFPLRRSSSAPKAGRAAADAVSVVTDFEAHALWMDALRGLVLRGRRGDKGAAGSARRGTG